MDIYEIRILPSKGFPYLIMAGLHFSDASAIRSAHSFADGHQFEVWRGMECVSDLAKAPVLSQR